MAEIEQFWEDTHQKDDILYLSGHSGITVLRGLFVTDYVDQLVPQESHILEIGVGLGICTKDLHALGFKISCLDISDKALERVKAFVAAKYKPDILFRLPLWEFDLVISYCVTQHMNNNELIKQLQYVIPSLKATGIFAMQYSWPFSGYAQDEHYGALVSGSCNRPIEMMYKMVEDAGGKIVDSRIFSVSPQYHAGWGILHIMRK
jgi:SAM-dependent methyltransferase